MRVPIGWLRDWVDVPADATHESVHAALVKVGFEEEDVITFGVTGPVVVGRVLSFEAEPQSNGKTIRWCQVDVGEAEPRGIVCGASNFEVGDLVVVSLPGAVLPGPFPISARKTYGHVSDGMMASARELGLGDEHSGILRLSELGVDALPGVDAIALLGLDDFAVDVNVTPDRGYAFSIRGLAREYAHATGAAFRDPAAAVAVQPAEGFPVVVDDQAPVRGRIGVTGIVTRVVRGIDPSRPTPPWMVARLTLAGIRSISLAVDITNYVMLELGQPIHGYDLARLRGGLTVRRATPGESLQTLDGVTRTLDPEDLLVCDESGPIGLAGVMGGATTELSGDTVDVLVEAATWERVTIARTARRHRLPSEASKRFERGVDPAIAAPAAQRVVDLLVQLAGGEVDALGSAFDASVPAASIHLPSDAVQRLIGAPFEPDEITGTLTALGATVEPRDGGWDVTPPSWRPDLTDAATLVEEVARIVGYDRIPSVLPVAPPGRGLTRQQRLRRLVSTGLAAAGFIEVLSYPWIASVSNDRFGSPETGGVPAVKLANPIDPDAAWLRTSLIPGLIGVARRNLSRGLTDLAVFESGAVFLPEADAQLGTDRTPIGWRRPDDDELAALTAGLPRQPWRIGALLLGDTVPRAPGRPGVPAGIADALDAARHVSAVVGAPLRIETGAHQSLHPGRTARLLSGDAHVGWAGELLPSLALELDLPRVVAVLELDLDALIAAADPARVATPIAAFPAATQDLTLVVSDVVRAGELLAVLLEGGGELLEHVALIDDYRGTGIPDGSKALTFALRFRSADRTLTAAEATAAKQAATALAEQRFGAAPRE